MEVCDAFVLTLNEIMVSTTRFLPLLNAFRFRLSKDLRYLRPRSLLKALLKEGHCILYFCPRTRPKTLLQCFALERESKQNIAEIMS